MRKPAAPARLLKTPHIVILTVAAIAIPLTISGISWATKGVTVVIDGESVYHTTKAETVSQVLDEVDVSVDSNDIVSPLPGTLITDGSEIVVRRSVPVTLECNGSTFEIDVIGTTVADALVSAGLDPSIGVHVTPPVDAALSEDMTITADELFMRVTREETAVPFEIVEEEDPTLLAGQRKIVRKGVPGEAIRIYEVLVVGDEETTRSVKAEQVLLHPVSQVVAVGTRVPVIARRTATVPPKRPVITGGADPSAAAPEAGDTLRVVATAYTPWDPGCGGISVIDRKLARWNVPDGWGIVAVDTSVIKMGTKLYVPGYGYAVAADTGGAISGNKIDVCYWAGGSSVAKAAARAWGRRTVTITIVE